MPRHVIGGLIQAAAPITDPAAPIEKVRQAAIDAHIPFGKYRKNHIPHTSGFWEKYFFMACSNRVGTEAPWNIGRFYGSSYFVDPRGNFLATGSEDKNELVVAEMDLDMIEEVRRVWQFYRDRRPDSYGRMAEPLP